MYQRYNGKIGVALREYNQKKSYSVHEFKNEILKLADPRFDGFSNGTSQSFKICEFRDSPYIYIYIYRVG